MNIVSSLLNRSESAVDKELLGITSNTGMRVFPKMRLSDVIQKGRTSLTQREFDFYTRSHFDFVLADNASRPLMVVEYDGPIHTQDRVQRERDEIKNELCQKANLGLLRINDRYVTKLENGMTLLRWIIEVREIAKAFDEAQINGQIPWDEPFDPTFVQPGVDAKGFPYWISQNSTQSIHEFFDKLDRSMPKGWTSICGEDEKGNGFRMSFLYFGEQVLWIQTGMKKQNLDFGLDDLLMELDTCELGLRLKKYREGEISSCAKGEILPIFQRFCEKYRALPSHSSGTDPFHCSWNPKRGWSF
jgi:very-short-patch-repair endonuclease